ncbi:class I SAM-dependent methyltransferase [Rhodohalobacter barkolensis]|uniref:SAM-dependent methyltransferase n=1 Tax=Rhodohalobacter barkolensis TaxID=2053187 RepID=A0A2N0VGJ8_9BACT|nr:class I SAM-dependent methyltransferase [Rhodohalobacter barkolensis]PKD43294.1 SAM-dependent methyltransferase [Rhodohalobacter barkolensis]
MKDFWNNRYSDSEYVYGKQPNLFFKRALDRMTPGKLLLPAEGEGRNAVYAAKQGWDVFAFDYSEEAKQKALALASESGANIRYEVSFAEDILLPENEYDAAALIFVHLPKDVFKPFLNKVINSLKSGGILILELYSEKQLGRESGGPKSKELLFDYDELRSLLKGVNVDLFEEKKVELIEGKYHHGEAVVIRGIATKK